MNERAFQLLFCSGSSLQRIGIICFLKVWNKKKKTLGSASFRKSFFGNSFYFSHTYCSSEVMRIPLSVSSLDRDLLDSQSHISLISLGPVPAQGLALRRPLIFFFFFFLGSCRWHMEVPRLGVKSELQLWTLPQPWQHWIQATYVTYACCNTRSLIHWVMPGIEPTSSGRQCWLFNPLSHGTPDLWFALRWSDHNQRQAAKIIKRQGVRGLEV